MSSQNSQCLTETDWDHYKTSPIFASIRCLIRKQGRHVLSQSLTLVTKACRFLMAKPALKPQLNQWPPEHSTLAKNIPTRIACSECQVSFPSIFLFTASHTPNKEMICAIITSSGFTSRVCSEVLVSISPANN